MKRIVSFVLIAMMLLTFMPTSYAAVNMVKNPGFETDTSWWKPSGASVIRQEKAAAVGKYGAYVTVTSNWGSMHTPVMNFKKGVTYTVSARIKLAEGLGTRSARFITSHDAGGKGTPAWIEMPSTMINDKEWTLVSSSFCYQGTNKTGKGTLQCRVGSGSELLSYYIDDYSIVSSEVTNYRETEYAEGEMVENKGFDVDSDGWIAKNGAAISRIVGEGYNNSEASGLVTSNGNGYVGVELNFVQGQTYDMSAFIKTAGSAAFFTLFVRHDDGTNEQVALLYPTDKDWNSMEGRYLHRRASGKALVYVTSNNTDSFYIDELSVIPKGKAVDIVTETEILPGEKGVMIDGTKQDLSVYITDGIVMVPIVELAYKINGTGTEENGVAVLKRGINVVRLTENATTMSVNGKEKKISVPARIINGKLYADAVAVAMELGVKSAASNGEMVIIKNNEGGYKLNYTAKKLRDDKSLTIGMLTGSRAQRAGTFDPYSTASRDVIKAWFNRNYADCTINVVESDVSATGIMLAAFRAKKFVEENNVDLLLVDVYRNDMELSAAETEEYATTLIRAAREANSSVDIVFLYTLTEELYNDYYSIGKKPESYDGYEKIAGVYSIPTADLGEALIKRMGAEGKEFLSYHNATKNPNTDGAKVYADAIVAKIKECLASSDEKTDRVTRNHAKSFDAVIDGFDNVKLGAGWSKIDESLSTSGTDSYITARQVGAEIEYVFVGNIIGLYYESNPKSGDILYSIDGGAYKSLSTFDKYSYEFEHMCAVLLAKDLEDGQHTLKIKVASTKNEEAKDTLIRIGGFLVGNK